MVPGARADHGPRSVDRGRVLLAIVALTFGLTACDSSKATPTPLAASSAGGVEASAGSGGAAGSVSAGGSDQLGGSPGSGEASFAPVASGSGTTGVGTTGGGTPAGGPATTLEQQFESVVGGTGPSVVLIETSEGLGSGVVLDGRGDIVTNAHVAGTSSSFRVTTASGERLDGTLVGTFEPDDVAVVRTSGGSLKPATFGDSSKLRVGQIVLAIGNPLGLQSSVTDGIISALGRTVSEPSGTAIPNAIQTSAPINPGNSGGALVDLAGAVIGIPTLAATDPELGGTAPGIGFAVPSNIVTDIAQQLIDKGKVVSSHRAYLGIRTANVTGADGVLVFSVAANGPAAKAGITDNVLITSIAGKPTPDSPTLAAVLAELEPGQTVDIVLESRDGSTKTVKVTLGELPG